MMQEYVQRWQATVEDYISKRLIYGLCTGADLMQGSSLILWWWEQYNIREEGVNGDSVGVDSEVE